VGASGVGESRRGLVAACWLSADAAEQVRHGFTAVRWKDERPRGSPPVRRATILDALILQFRHSLSFFLFLTVSFIIFRSERFEFQQVIFTLKS
jgi:hypothetical protein